jgi:hypothetical protein
MQFKQNVYRFENLEYSYSLNMIGVLDFVHQPVLQRTLKNATFRKLVLCRSSGDRAGNT